MNIVEEAKDGKSDMGEKEKERHKQERKSKMWFKQGRLGRVNEHGAAG